MRPDVASDNGCNMHTPIPNTRILLEMITKFRTAHMPKLWPKSRFVRQVATVSSSAAVAQLVGLVVGPINSRLYEPADFGLVAPFGSLFSILTVLTTMRYEMAIPVAEDDDEGLHILVLCGTLALFWCCSIAIATFAFEDRIAHALSPDPRLSRYLWYLPIGLFGTTVYLLLSAWVIRMQAFRDLSISAIIQNVTGSGSAVLMGFLQMGVSGLVAGSLIASVSGITSLISVAFRSARTAWHRLSFAAMLAAARRYHNFPLYNIWATLLNTVSLQLPVLLLSAGFGARETGWYGYCQRVLLLPTVLISGAMVPVFYSHAKQALVDGSLPRLTSRMIEGIVGINAFFIAVIAMFGPELFTLAFGEPWRQAGLYASVLTPWLLVNFIVTPLATLPLVLERQRSDLVWQVILVVVRAGTISVGVYRKDDVLAMAAFGAGSGVFMVAYLIWLLRIAGVGPIQVMLRLFRELLIACVLVGACRALYTWSQGSIWVAGAALGASGAWWAKRVLHQYRAAGAGL
jgi:O-antigen/teichoic acid export membrane protein